MDLQNFYCHGRPDAYAIVTSIFYLLLGSLGLLVNNSYLSDIFALLFVAGIAAIAEFSGWLFLIHYVPLLISMGLMCHKFNAELIKVWSDERIDESETVMGISGEKFYRLPVSLMAVFVFSFMTFTLIDSTYDLIVWTMLLLIILHCYTMLVLYLYFKPGMDKYSKTRILALKLTLTVVLAEMGLFTSYFCPSNNWTWIETFIGSPIVNICLPYCLFTFAQILLLLRGKNLRRRTKLNGDGFIIVAYYTGRFSQK